MGSKHEILGDFASKVAKTYGSQSVAPAHLSGHNRDIPRLRLGALSFDIVTGGGIPLGRNTMFYGKKSSGKTTHVYRAIGQAQKLCRNCLRMVESLEVVEIDYGGEAPDGYPTHEAKGQCDCVKIGLVDPYHRPGESDADFLKRSKALTENSYEEYMCFLMDIENSYDPSWAEALGIDSRRLYRMVPGTAEEAIDVSDAIMRTGVIDLVAIDSMAVMTPSKEIEASTEEWQQGLQARLLNKAVRKWTAAINEMSKQTGHTITMLLIQQLRQKIGVMFGSPDTIPGGMGQGFFTSMEVKCWASGIESEAIELGSKKEKMTRSYAVRLNFKIEKNKTAPPKQEGSFRMFLVDDESMRKCAVDEEGYILKLAMQLDLIQREKANKYVYLGETFTSQAGLKEWLREDPWRFNQLKNTIIDFLLGHSPEEPVSQNTDSIALKGFADKVK